MATPTVLFSTPIGPYRTHAWNNSLTDLQEQRFSVGQDIFTFRGHMHCPALHSLAQNISAPSVLLEYPRWEEFREEVRKGYDYVGISFMHNHVEVVMEMCRMIRALSPQSQVVLGWHGARGIGEPSKRYLYKSSAHVRPGERPYRVVYPQPDRGFEAYREIRRLKMSLFDAVSAMADRYDEWRGVKRAMERPGGSLKVGKFL